MSLLHTLRSAANKVGLEVTRFGDVQYSPFARVCQALRYNKVDLVLDVGANDGGYVRELRAHGYSGRVLSFEPLPDAHEKLVAAHKADPAWAVADRCAIGAENGVVEIGVASNSVSSSILPVLPSHLEAAAAAVQTLTEKVPLCTLDSIQHPFIAESTVRFLKIDTQGYEEHVLRGAARVLEGLAGVQLELSVVALYEGQALYSDLLRYLENAGFELWGVLPGFGNPQTGRTLQFDAVMFR